VTRAVRGDGHRFVVVSVATTMARKKKDRLRVHKEARRLARLGVGMPPTERTIPDKRLKVPKHKKKLVAQI
jgi:mRNA-degrading endonuclease toxin of MazEF toxin-antitoxin module